MCFLRELQAPAIYNAKYFWDCSESPMLLQPEKVKEPLPADPSGDVLLRNIPVLNALAISVAFCSGRIVAIASHRQREQYVPLYRDADDSVVWTHFPLSNDEKILGIWVVCLRDKEINLGANSLIASLSY